MKKSLGIQSYLILSNVFLIVLALGVVGSIWSSGQEVMVERALRGEVRERAILISALIAGNLTQQPEANLDSLLLPESEIKDDLTAVFVSADLRARSLNDHPITDELQQYINRYAQSAFSGHITTSEIYDQGGTRESIYSAAPVRDENGQIIGVVCLILPLDPLENHFASIRTTFFEAAAGAALLGLIISALLAVSISRQITAAKQLVELVSDGDYHLRLPEIGPKEFRELAGYLNRMVDELEKQTQQRQTLLSNVTHELARPLGGLRLGIDSLKGGAINDPIIANDLLTSMSQTIQRMESLLDDITLAAHPKTRPIVLDIKPINLTRFLQALVVRFKPAAKNRNIEINLNLPDHLPVINADEKRLNQIMGNLVDNALKFTGRDKPVIISAKAVDERQVQLLVQDGGQGLSPKDMPYLFLPFYQGQSGKRIRQGMGLGLVIARQLAEIHGGTLELKNHPSGGAIAILTLPITQGISKAA